VEGFRSAAGSGLGHPNPRQHVFRGCAVGPDEDEPVPRASV